MTARLNHTCRSAGWQRRNKEFIMSKNKAEKKSLEAKGKKNSDKKKKGDKKKSKK